MVKSKGNGTPLFQGNLDWWSIIILAQWSIAIVFSVCAIQGQPESGRSSSGHLGPCELKMLGPFPPPFPCWSTIKKGHLPWSNYSDLTRPHPKWWLVSKIPFFQGNLGWWTIPFGQIYWALHNFSLGVVVGASFVGSPFWEGKMRSLTQEMRIFFQGNSRWNMRFTQILLMEEIRLTTWDVKKHVNNGINYQPQLVKAGFLNHQQYYHSIDSFLQPASGYGQFPGGTSKSCGATVCNPR